MSFSKKLLASMVVLGLASSSAFAQEPAEATRAELATLKARLAKMEAVLDQNQAGVLQRDQEQARDWFQRVTVSGRVDSEAWVSKRDPITDKDTTSYGVDLPVANLYVDAQINRWAKAHMTLGYYNSVSRLAKTYAALNGAGTVVKDGNDYYVVPASSNFGVVEAYATLGNLGDFPVYARIGQQFLPFGNYDPYATTPSFTQLLSQNNQVAAQVGFVMENGVSGALYTYDGTPKRQGQENSKIRSFGGQLAFANNYNDVSYRLAVGAMNNMADIAYVNSILSLGSLKKGYMQERYVGAVSVDGSLAMNQFDVNANYVTAMTRFNKADLMRSATAKDGARPSALSVDAGYSFALANRDSRIGLGYQRTWESGFLYLPQDRFQAQYDIELVKNIDLGLQVYHDRNYKANENGNDKNNTTGVVRLSAKFA